MKVLYKYVSAERALICLPKMGNGTLRATQPSALNDPFECSARVYHIEIAEEHDYSLWLDVLNGINPKTPIDRSEYNKAMRPDESSSWLDLFRRQISQRFGVVSFASDPLHPLLWAHYTTDGSGFVIGYKVSDLRELVDESGLETFQPVQYYASPLIIPREDILKIDAAIINVLLAKSTYWKHEGEWRLIKRLSNTTGTGKSDDKGQSINLVTIPNEAVAEVYCTERTPTEHVETVNSRLCEENNRFEVRQVTRLQLSEMSYNYVIKSEQSSPATLDTLLTEPDGSSTERMDANGNS